MFFTCIFFSFFQRIWDKDDMLQRWGGDEILVKWANWIGPPTWGSLSANPQLVAYLTWNRASPHTGNSVNWVQLDRHPCADLHTEVLASHL